MSSLKDLGIERHDTREAFAGGCYVNGEPTCVKQPEDYCDFGTFLSGRYLRANPENALHYCTTRMYAVVIGRCGDSGKCSNLASRCEDETSFVPFDPTCTITKDLATDEYTTYGACGVRCVWSPNDCEEGETYTSNTENCTADNVQIGSCSYTFCAVGPETCVQPNTRGAPYRSHQEVYDSIGVNCILSSLSPPDSATTQQPATTTYNDHTMTTSVVRKNILDPFTVTIISTVAISIGFMIGIGVMYFKRSSNEETDHGCCRPKRMEGTVRDVDMDMESVSSGYSHDELPDDENDSIGDAMGDISFAK